MTMIEAVLAISLASFYTHGVKQSQFVPRGPGDIMKVRVETVKKPCLTCLLNGKGLRFNHSTGELPLPPGFSP